jgi:hypothetical protein
MIPGRLCVGVCVCVCAINLLLFCFFLLLLFLLLILYSVRNLLIHTQSSFRARFFLFLRQ